MPLLSKVPHLFALVANDTFDKAEERVVFALEAEFATSEIENLVSQIWLVSR